MGKLEAKNKQLLNNNTNLNKQVEAEKRLRLQELKGKDEIIEKERKDKAQL